MENYFKVVPSANNINSKKFEVRQRSLMYIKNKNGPRMDPRGKPQEMSSTDDCTIPQ